MARTPRLPFPSRFLVLLLIWASSWLAAAPPEAHADIITADFGNIVVPPTHEQAISPYYDCEPGHYSDTRLCHYLWQNGLELLSNASGLYADGYILMLDGGLSPAELHPRCEADLAPCFSTFTPLLFELETGGNGAFSPFFISSSRGGYMEFLATSETPSHAIPFSGDEWSDLASLQVGFYTPDDCEIREDLDYTCAWDVALSGLKLTFEADTQTVPEPLGLVPLGVVLWGLHRRRVLGRSSRLSVRT